MLNIKAGLTAIAAEVLEDIRKEAEATIQKSEKEAKQTLKTAKEEAEKAYSATVGEATAKAEAEKRRIKSLTEVEKRNRLLIAKEELVNAAFDRACKRLTAFAKTEEYYAYLISLIAEASDNIGSKRVVVQVNSADKKWLVRGSLSDIQKKLGLDLELAPETLDCIGGCKVQTADRSRILDETFENCMVQLKPALRVETAKIFFGEEGKVNGS
jgi:V/A-type H+/Na+-transporting ATPase subunit E